MRNPLIPMLAITGKPDKKQIYELIDKYAQCGFEQLMLYPRDGCELDYLSDEWFDTINNFIAAGKRHNMRFWLYDEYNYPSGGCKGTVMKQNADFCINYLKAVCKENRFVPQLCVNEKYPNILNPDAVDFFIKSTHEQYKKHFGKYFGNEIAGVFTDEPSFYYGIWEKDELPFYDTLADDYIAICGNDFYTDYDLYYSKKGADDFIKNCYKLFAERMYSSYTSRINNWCRENNLYMTGHLMNDDNPTVSVRANGNLLKQLSGFSLPAVDDIFSQVGHRRVLMSFSAIQYASLGKDGAAAELFALGPCDISFSKMKLMIWYAALFGINNYFLAISHLDVRGNAFRRYYFNDFSPSVPRSFAYVKLGEEAKKAAKTAGEKYSPEVYIRFPWDEAANGIFNDNKINERWGELLKIFVKYQIQYLVIQDENTEDKPVVEVLQDGFSLNGEFFASVSSMAEILKPQNIYIEKNGELPEDIVVRRLGDKTVLLNLSENSRTLLYNNKEVYLPPFAVKFVDEKELKYKSLFDINVNKTVYKDRNLSGADFSNSGKFEFELKEKMKLIFALRDYPQSVNVYLDNVQIMAESKSSILPDSFNALYVQSAEIELPEGTHTLSVDGEIKNYKYLPDVILTGDFYRHGNTFSSNRFDKTEVKRFGRCSYSFDIKLPEQNGLSLQINGLSEPIRLYADGKLLGDCISDPYIWNIPDDYMNKKVCFTAETASDLSPVFGDTALVENCDGTPKWCAGYNPAFENYVSNVTAELKKLVII